MNRALKKFWSRIRRQSYLELSPDPERLFSIKKGDGGIVLCLSSFILFLIETAQQIPEHEEWFLCRIDILPNTGPFILTEPENKSVLRHTEDGLVCCQTDGGKGKKEVALKARVYMHNPGDGLLHCFNRSFILRLSILEGTICPCIEDSDDHRDVRLDHPSEIVAVARFDFDEQWRGWNNDPKAQKPNSPFFIRLEKGAWQRFDQSKEVER